jgi:hypothetical protein
VGVHVGIDPVTKKRHRLEEIVPAGPKAATQAQPHVGLPSSPFKALARVGAAGFEPATDGL